MPMGNLDMSALSPDKGDMSMEQMELLHNGGGGNEITSAAPEVPLQQQPKPAPNLIPVAMKPGQDNVDEDAAKLDKILDKVEKKKEEEKAAIKKNLALLKKKENKVDESRVQQLAPTAVPSLYDNSALFKRDTVEQRLDKYNEVMGTGADPNGPVDEGPK